MEGVRQEPPGEERLHVLDIGPSPLRLVSDAHRLAGLPIALQVEQAQGSLAVLRGRADLTCRPAQVGSRAQSQAEWSGQPRLAGQGDRLVGEPLVLVAGVGLHSALHLGKTPEPVDHPVGVPDGPCCLHAPPELGDTRLGCAQPKCPQKSCPHQRQARPRSLGVGHGFGDQTIDLRPGNLPGAGEVEGLVGQIRAGPAGR